MWLRLRMEIRNISAIVDLFYLCKGEYNYYVNAVDSMLFGFCHRCCQLITCPVYDIVRIKNKPRSIYCKLVTLNMRQTRCQYLNKK